MAEGTAVSDPGVDPLVLELYRTTLYSWDSLVRFVASGRHHGFPEWLIRRCLDCEINPADLAAAMTAYPQPNGE